MQPLICLTEDLCQKLNGMLDRGGMFSAWEYSKNLRPLAEWQPGRQKRLAARIASGVGGERLGSALDWINWRHHKTSARFYHQALFSRLSKVPPVTLLPELDHWLSTPGKLLQDRERADLLAFKAWTLATLADFKPAHEAILAALATDGEDSWIHVQHSDILKMEDRYDEALEAAMVAVKLQPIYRPAICQLADCLILTGQGDEAILKLREVVESTEQGLLAMRLQALYSEREDHENALWCLDRGEKFMPLMPESTRQWAAGRRANFLYLAGKHEESLVWRDRAGKGFHQKAATSLRRPDALARKRKKLAVPFVRQHHMTCAPATLASLSKFWNRDHDHLKIAAAICAEGTPWHKERNWAESHGFITREFRLTREILMALIDRDLPFTLTTSWVTSGHLQACIGYDDRTETIIFRDPTESHHTEHLLEELMKSNALYGPRCLLVLPAEESHRLDKLVFPDEKLYNAYHELEEALENHDRGAAEMAISTMRAINSEHSLTLSAGLSLAGYLRQPLKRLEIVKKLTQQFPNSQFLRYQMLYVLRFMEDRSAVGELLAHAVEDRECDPALIVEYGEFLMADARRFPHAKYYLEKATNSMRRDGRPLFTLAEFHEKNGDFFRASQLNRYASTLRPGYESYAEAYFTSCRRTGKVSEGLEFLTERTLSHGRKNHEPWLTLASAYHSLHQTQKAVEVIEEAMRQMPEEGYLKIQAGSMMLTWGKSAREHGLQLIEQSKGKVPETLWFRKSASAAGFVGERRQAIKLWQSLLAQEPTAVDAYRALARLTAEEQGTCAAIQFLKEATRIHPRQSSLWVLLAEWAREEEPETEQAALHQSRELDPDDIWVLRQIAITHFDSGDTARALDYAREAVQRSPYLAESHGVLGNLLHRADHPKEAVNSMRKALMISVDYTYSLRCLMNWAEDSKTAGETFAFIREEMLRQVSNGACILEFQELAPAVLKPEELLAQLRVFCEARPDLWQTWSARLTQALAMELELEARECADHLRKFFPLLPRTWVDLGRVERATGHHPQEAEALQQAVALAPGWDWAICQLGEVFERLGRYQEAEEVFAQALLHDPLNGPNHGYLANLIYKSGRQAEAFKRLYSSLRLCPFYTWGWQTLVQWSKNLECEDEVRALMEETSVRYSNLPRWWQVMSEIQTAFGQHEKALAAMRHALELAPSNSGLRDALVVLLANTQHYDEALELCEKGEEQEHYTREIQGRKAWVLMQYGRSSAALQAMEELLSKAPGYAWGWQQLTIWRSERSEWEKALAAATEWTRLCPEEAVAYGYMAQAAKALEQTSLAKRNYERAYRLEASYQYAGRQLLHAQIDSREFDNAKLTLSRLRHYTPCAWVEASAVSLEIACGKPEEAFSIARMLVEETQDADPLVWVYEQFEGCGLALRWKEHLQNILLNTPDVSPQLMVAWAKTCRSGYDFKKAAHFLKKLKIHETSRNAGWDALLWAANTHALPDLIRHWIWWHRKRFHQDARLWNSVGQLLLTMNLQRRSAKWLADWQSRPDDTGAHTLVNLSAAIDHVWGPEKSSAIREEGIRLIGLNNDNVLYLYSAQAAYLASTGQIKKAAALVQHIDDARISDYYRGLADLARAVIAVDGGNEQLGKQKYLQALEQLRTHRSAPHYFTAAQKQLSARLPWARRNSTIARTWGDVQRGPGLIKRVGFAFLITVAVVLSIAMVIVAPPAFIVPLIILSLIKNFRREKG